MMVMAMMNRYRYIRIGDITPAFEQWLICCKCHNLMGLCVCHTDIIHGRRYHEYTMYDPISQTMKVVRDPESESLRFGRSHTRREYKDVE